MHVKYAMESEKVILTVTIKRSGILAFMFEGEVSNSCKYISKRDEIEVDYDKLTIEKKSIDLRNSAILLEATFNSDDNPDDSSLINYLRENGFREIKCDEHGLK